MFFFSNFESIEFKIKTNKFTVNEPIQLKIRI